MSLQYRYALEERENCENNGKLVKYLRIRKGTKMEKNIFIKIEQNHYKHNNRGKCEKQGEF